MTTRKSAKAISKALSELAQETDAVQRVKISLAVREAAEALEQSAVVEARADGATWTAIGRVFGMSKQAAQQRFRH